MKIIQLLTLAALMGLAACRPHDPALSIKPTPTPAPAKDAYEANRRLGRGVNLGNALEAPREGEWGVTLQESDFQLIKDAGFDSVRIPIRWSAHTAETAPYTVDPEFFARVDWAIDQALSHGLKAVINIHHYDELMTSTQQHEPRFLALWRQIAQRYANYPDTLYFEVLNEPHDIGDVTWNRIQNQAIAAIRESNPSRYLVVGPVDWYSHRRLSDLKLPEEDRNLIASFHYYQPFQFTHQGADWVAGSDQWLGTTWEGKTAQKGDVDWDLNVAAQWGKDNDRPIYLGEFGAYSKADIDSRARWTAYVARQAEARDMSTAYWEWRAAFGVYDGDQQQFREPIRQALFP